MNQDVLISTQESRLDEEQNADSRSRVSQAASSCLQKGGDEAPEDGVKGREEEEKRGQAGAQIEQEVANLRNVQINKGGKAIKV